MSKFSTAAASHVNMPDVHRLAITQFLAQKFERELIRRLSQLGSSWSFVNLLACVLSRRRQED